MHVLVEKIITMLSPLSSGVLLLTSNRSPKLVDFSGKSLDIRWTSSNSFLERDLSFLLGQLKISFELIRHRRDYDTCVTYVGGTLLIVPIATLWLLRRRCIVIVTGSGTASVLSIYRQSHGRLVASVLSSLVSLAEKSVYELADVLVVYSFGQAKSQDLARWSGKVRIAREHFVDPGVFRVRQPYNQRDQIMGFIGRFSNEKGILELANAIPETLRARPNLRYVLCGDGLLTAEVLNLLSTEIRQGSVRLVGWVPQNELSAYLNTFTLLVIPSRTEGLPNVLLEAMASGTPVLVARVGAIPDIVEDEENGFLLGSTSPDSIGNAILRLLKDPTMLAKVSSTALEYVGDKFTLERTRSQWKALLDS